MTITYDVAAYQTTTSGFYTPGIATSTTTGRKITGQEKLAQRFILELMTEVGSMPLLPTRGSYFMAFLRNGNLYSDRQIFDAFNVGLLGAANNLRNEETDSDDLNERFLAATLRSVAITSNVLQLTCSLANQAGELIELNIPIEMTINPADLSE